MRAYGGCAAECLRLAPKVILVDKVAITISYEFQHHAFLCSRLREFDAERVKEEFGSESVALSVKIPVEQLETVRQLVSDITRGRGCLQLN